MEPSRLASIAGAAIVAWAISAQGVDKTWNRTTTLTGTNWEENAYWTGGLPGASDRAYLPSATVDARNRPCLSNDSVQVISGIFMYGNYSVAATWQILNSDPARPGKIVLGARGIENRQRAGGFLIEPDIELAADQLWQIDPDYNDAAPTLTGRLSGSGRLTRGGNCGTTLGSESRYQRRDSPTFTGGLEVQKGHFRWSQLGLTTADAGAYGFGTAPITLAGSSLNGGGFLWACTALAGNDGFVMSLTNAIVVNGLGHLRYEQNGGTGYRPNCRFSGQVTLNGALRLYGAIGVGSMPRYEGAITIDRQHYGTAGLSKGEYNYEGYNPQYTDGLVADGPGIAVKPLVLQSQAHAFGPRGSHTYAGGTVVSWCGDMAHGSYQASHVSVPAGTVLGTSDLTVEPGGRLALSEPANLAAAATATLQNNAVGVGTLALAYNGLPALAADSEGVIAVDTATYNAIDDLSAVGNGACFLGTRTGGTFTGTTLAPGSGSLYRLGGGNLGNVSLTVASGVLTGSAGLQVGRIGWHGNGGVRLNGANTFSGPIDVTGMLVCFNGASVNTVGSILEGNAQTPVGASPFGSATGTVALHGSRLRLYGVASGQPVVKGPLAFEGSSLVVVDSTSGNRPTSLQFDGITRQNRGFLRFDPYFNRAGGNEKLLFTNQVDTAFMPPYVVHHSSNNGTAANADFASYDATGATGLRAFAAYHANLLTSTSADVVSWAGAGAGGAYAAKALKTTGAITGTGTISLGDGTYAGLILNGDVAPALNFGTAEAVVYNAADRSITGKLSGSGGITKNGTGNLTISNTANDFTGDIVVNGGILVAAIDSAAGTGSLGNTGNNITLNGGVLKQVTSGDRLAATRTVTLGPLGGYLMLVSYGSPTVYSRITGPGFLGQNHSGASLIIAGTGNDYAGGTWIGYGNWIVNAGSQLGTGPVAIGPMRVLTVKGNDGIHAGARLHVALAGAALFESAAPVVGSLSGGGDVRLGTATVASTLDVGGDDRSSTFLGRVYEVSASKPGALIKRGSGTFTLYGDHTFTGASTVQAGRLALYGAVTGACTVQSGAILAGTGGKVGGNLTVDGTWEVELRGNGDADTLVCGGALDVDGATLTLSVADGYVPQPGTLWTLASGATSVSGAFADLPAGFRVVAPGDGTLQLTRTATGTVVLLR